MEYMVLAKEMVQVMLMLKVKMVKPCGTTGSVPTGASIPLMEDRITVLVDAFAEIADAAEGHAHGELSEDDEVWMEEEESTRSRWRRYVQSGQDQVSDRDEWADIHYGPATSRTTPRRPRYCKIYTKYAYASRELCQKFLQIAVINV